MKIHAMIFDNEHHALCGTRINDSNTCKAYAFMANYKKGSYCKKCYSGINKWDSIKPQTEAEKVKREGRY